MTTLDPPIYLLSLNLVLFAAQEASTSFWDGVREFLVHELWKVLGGAIATAVVAYRSISHEVAEKRKADLARQQAELARQQAEIAKAQSDVQLATCYQMLYGKNWPGPTTRPRRLYHHVLVVGKGGSGKSKLLSGLLAKEGPGLPSDKAPTYALRHYSQCHAITWEDDRNGKRVQRTEVITVDFNDVSGQRLKDIGHDLNSENPRLNPVTSMLLVVDLFNPPGSTGEKTPQAAEFDQKRIAEHNETWHQDFLDSMQTHAREGIETIFLFINKIDLLDLNSPKLAAAAQRTGTLQSEKWDMTRAEEEAKKAYGALANRLQRMSPDSSLKIIVGSAKTGMGLPELLKEILSTGIDRDDS